MSELRSDFLYSEEHEWVQTVGEDTVRIGITEFAQHQLGDIVFVELPDLEASVAAAESIGTIESVKTVSDLFSPVSGTIVAVNEALQDSPELVNSSPYEEGWMIEIRVEGDLQAALSALLNADAYRKHIE
ncbi:glycine cleavage system protein GcvH [Paenibacillus barcinonensis]|uniref:glycine cleavage system protein GcvH n=1 Tax=Paenibacillus TaxID=44249 RepID=UPI001C1141F4|nr:MULTISPECIES: glycine cleavage system protein GcvH [Paenibacillus]MBU5355540.1 glycine cleavage system protein GcvH [Paenibacillus barcinonensis]MDM5276098.1 glycine cleavage system protein GcvH [Paenibacillus silvae]